jgi:uncharacterized membrane protein
MSVNPFDIKTMLIARHAQHVVLIHFPIAVFTVAVAFDYCAHWTNNRPLSAVFTVPVVATGLIAWQFGPRGTRTQRDSANAPGSGLHHWRADLACVLDPLACAASSRRILAKVPPAARSDRGVACGVGGTSRRVSQ